MSKKGKQGCKENEIATKFLNELVRDASSIDEILKSHKNSINKSFNTYATSLINKKGFKKNQLCKNAEIPISYGYEMLNGKKKKPNRDYVLSLGLAMYCHIDEIQRLLTLSGNATLYNKLERDMIISHGIRQKKGRVEINIDLFERGLEPINEKT